MTHCLRISGHNNSDRHFIASMDSHSFNKNKNILIRRAISPWSPFAKTTNFHPETILERVLQCVALSAQPWGPWVTAAQTQEGPRFLELPDWKAGTDNGNASAPEAGLRLGAGGTQLGNQGLVTKSLQSHYVIRMRRERQLKLCAQ